MKNFLIYLISLAILAQISFLIINFYFDVLESKFNFKSF